MHRLVGYIHGQEFFDTHINKTYWTYTCADLLDIFMDKNSWIHILARLILFLHGHTCWIPT